MPVWGWITLVALHLLTVLWYLFMRHDMRSYIRTQVKILGEGNRDACDTSTIRGLLVAYLGVLFILMAAVTFYLSRL